MTTAQTSYKADAGEEVLTIRQPESNFRKSAVFGVSTLGLLVIIVLFGGFGDGTSISTTALGGVRGGAKRQLQFRRLEDCVPCSDRVQASVQPNGGSFCYRRNGDDCSKYWGRQSGNAEIMTCVGGATCTMSSVRCCEETTISCSDRKPASEQLNGGSFCYMKKEHDCSKYWGQPAEQKAEQRPCKTWTKPDGSKTCIQNRLEKCKQGTATRSDPPVTAAAVAAVDTGSGEGEGEGRVDESDERTAAEGEREGTANYEGDPRTAPAAAAAAGDALEARLREDALSRGNEDDEKDR